MKQTEGNQVFIGCRHGSLYEYSMNEKRIVHEFGKILGFGISSMATTFDNKYLFVCDGNDFIEFDISTRTQVNNFEVRSAVQCCVVTYDNQFLITSDENTNSNLR